MTFDLREGAPRVCFGLACAIGLAGAFVGLNVSGFWLDELFTHWVVDPGGDFRQVAARLLTDVHPPLYYGLMALYARVFGASEAALRSFSALCGCGAILVFILGAGKSFSQNARLFAAALATGSSFWFYQTQNARDYALCLLIGSVILVLTLRLLPTGPPSTTPVPATLWALFGVMAAGAFTHFYLMYVCLAVLMVLGLYHPRWRLLLGAAFIALLVISEAYVRLVIGHYSQYSLTSTWIQNDPVWRRDNLVEAGRQTLNFLAVGSLAICGFAALYARLQRPHAADDDGARRLPLDPVLVLCLGVPVIVLCGGLVSSALISPNFTSRNLLVTSPFVWGAFAWLYGAGPERCPPRLRLTTALALSALTAGMATVVLGRAQPHNTPFREAAAWIEAFPSCRGAVIPVLSVNNASWVRPGFDEVIATTAYGYHLKGFAPLRVIPVEALTSGGLPADLRAEIERRIDGVGCPVLGWAAQGFDARQPDALTHQWLAMAGRTAPAPGLAVKAFQTYTYGLDRRPEPSGTAVLFMDRGEPRR
jgi:hypothetical protein